MKACVIIASQPVSPVMKRYIAPGAFVIAADAGWQNAQRLGVVPHLVLGDFDSAPPPAEAAELLRLPAEKDDTDTMFAARQALERGFEQLTLLGALGGRLDHQLGNLQVLLYLARRGAVALAAGETAEVRCVAPGTLRLVRQPGRFLSVLAVGGEAAGVFLQGVKYPLENAVLTPDYPLGVSNEFVQDEAVITHSAGYLYVITAEEAV